MPLNVSSNSTRYNMATALTFTKNPHDKWEASLISTGDRLAVEVNRKATGSLIVYGHIGSLEPIILQDFGPSAAQDIMFEIDVPEGVEITIVSYPEIADATMTDV